MTTTAALRGLYPDCGLRHSFHLGVSDGHSLFVAEAGRADGMPVLFLHGGPGMGFGPEAHRYFDPDHYRIILIDQRGCARSSPLGSLAANTTDHLIDDLERVRQACAVRRWIVFGGSWGSALALAYASAHPHAIAGLVLRGIFLGTRAEDRWQYQFGAHALFPEEWQSFESHVRPDERYDLLAAYQMRLNCGDVRTEVAAAQAFAVWASRTNVTNRDFEEEALLRADWIAPFIVAGARIAVHYAVHGSFLEAGPPLIDRVTSLRGVPTRIIHGTGDAACLPASAYALAQTLNAAQLEMIEGAPHSPRDPRIRDALVRACDDFRAL